MERAACHVERGPNLLVHYPLKTNAIISSRMFRHGYLAQHLPSKRIS